MNKVKPKKKLEIGNQHTPSTTLFVDLKNTPINKKTNTTKDKRLSISLDHLNLTELKTIKQKIKAKVKKTKKPFSQIITKQILS